MEALEGVISTQIAEHSGDPGSPSQELTGTGRLDHPKRGIKGLMPEKSGDFGDSSLELIDTGSDGTTAHGGVTTACC